MWRRWAMTGIGLVLMGGSLYGFHWYAERTAVSASTVEVWQPVRTLKSGEVVQESMLRKVLVPESAVQGGTVRQAEEAVGKTVVVPIGPEEQLLQWKLSEQQVSAKEGERYISFSTDEVTNVGNLMRRGDRVDVWVEFEAPRWIAGERLGALKVVEGLAVASVRTAEGVELTEETAFASPFPGGSGDPMREGDKGKPAINTFIMTEETYEAYTLASLEGSIKLALPDLSSQQADEGSSGMVTAEFRWLQRQEGGMEQ